MGEHPMPPLQLEEIGDRCRLSLGSWCYGNGLTLQEAADDLIIRLLHLAQSLRSSGFSLSPECGPPDHACLEFIWQLGERAARGEDIRPHVFGTPRATP